ncbi:MAG TPA: hypothetical protein VJ011_12870 [Steroidobacteraceae bacterium]|nr:hypothetical protein [Steroidobacteraceae bacterium]
MRLRAHGLRYSLEHEPSDAVLVRIARPGERWEAAIFADGRIELETFAGTDGVVSGAEAGEALERLFSDTGSDA